MSNRVKMYILIFNLLILIALFVTIAIYSKNENADNNTGNPVQSEQNIEDEAPKDESEQTEPRTDESDTANTDEKNDNKKPAEKTDDKTTLDNSEDSQEEPDTPDVLDESEIQWGPLV